MARLKEQYVNEIAPALNSKFCLLYTSGRFRRQGMHAGYTAASKKAIVTLTKEYDHTGLSAVDVNINARSGSGRIHSALDLDLGRCV